MTNIKDAEEIYLSKPLTYLTVSLLLFCLPDVMGVRGSFPYHVQSICDLMTFISYFSGISFGILGLSSYRSFYQQEKKKQAAMSHLNKLNFFKFHHQVLEKNK